MVVARDVVVLRCGEEEGRRWQGDYFARARCQRRGTVLPAESLGSLLVDGMLWE